MDILDQIRAECAQVAALATHVKINHERIGAYAAPLGAEQRFRHLPRVSGAARERAAAYWMTLDAINFGSGWFPTLLKMPGMTGYRTVKTGVDRRFRDDGAWNAGQLQKITVAEISTLMGQEPDHPLMGLFKASLRDLGSHVETDGGGSFAALVDAADRSAAQFVQTLSSWRCFADFSEYHGRTVPFLKRAQIAAADLFRANVAAWSDIRRLTLFADNLVPHVLRLDGILTFDTELVRRIDSQELIEHGSSEEVEIRACALQAVELLVAASATNLSAASVDQILWNRGQGPRYKAAPRHRARCTAY